MGPLRNSNCLFLLSVVCDLFLSAASISSRLENNLGGSSCDRDCTGRPMECHYEFKLESYTTMSKACYSCPSVLADCFRPHCVPGTGFKRLLLTVNRQMPGPQIRVCEGDTVIVKVTNLLYNAETTTMHWHGIHQKETPYMDGVPMLTQCPIYPETSWTYRFKADPPGTHWYHSHTGPQRADGLYGALVVKEVKNKVSHLYDHDIPDHTIIVTDFEKTAAVIKVVMHEQSKGNNKPDFLLFNGQGAGEPVKRPSWLKTGDWTERTTPYYQIPVVQGSRYRMRLISNAVLNCPIEIFIEDHNFTVIATDGAPIDPVEAKVLVISGGETWDIVVHADEPVKRYWLYGRGIADCAPTLAQQLAVLNYNGSTAGSLPDGNTDAAAIRDKNPDWVVVNPFNQGIVTPVQDDGYIPLTELSSREDAPAWITEEPNHKFYLGMDLYWVDNDLTNHALYYSQQSQLEIGGRTVIAQINRISGISPDRPTLSQYDQVNQNSYCTYDSSKHFYTPANCSQDGCYCTHRVKVKVGDVVEMILIDEGKPFNLSSHTMHIHGNYWAVVAMGQAGDQAMTRAEVIKMDTEGRIPRNFTNPILKDTILLPDGGYVVTKFKALNPGVWLMHCHNSIHEMQGMKIIVEVGEPKEWSVIDNLPRCGSYHYSDSSNPPSEKCDRMCDSIASVSRAWSTPWLTLLGLFVLLLKA